MDNQQDHDALPKACREGNLEDAKQLLENGANINIKNINGETPLSISEIEFNIRE